MLHFYCIKPGVFYPRSDASAHRSCIVGIAKYMRCIAILINGRKRDSMMGTTKVLIGYGVVWHRGAALI